MRIRHCLTLATILTLTSWAAGAADYPTPKEDAWVAPSFRFHTGETLPNLKLAYTTVGNPSGEPVLVLHGTAGSAAQMLNPGFAGELFGPGQPLDAQKYFIILPDALGAGKSARPSDGLRAGFPKYDYDDMVLAQYRLVTEGLGLHHLRLVIGNSMGGMQAWDWGVSYPDFMDALVPMASQPAAMSQRNWILRRMLVESVRRDPAYDNGNYTTQPPALGVANVFFGFATSGGTLAYANQAPTSALADKMVDAALAAPPPPDANNFIFQWESSRDFDPTAKLADIKARVLAINSADDERNPPETGVMDRALQHIPGAKLYLIPASTETRGHGTTGMAKFWKDQLKILLDTTPKRGA